MISLVGAMLPVECVIHEVVGNIGLLSNSEQLVCLIHGSILAHQSHNPSMKRKINIKQLHVCGYYATSKL
jgi:hypothetical protein